MKIILIKKSMGIGDWAQSPISKQFFYYTLIKYLNKI